MNKIVIKDNLFDKEEIKNIYNFCRELSYKRNETDDVKLPYTGLVHNFNLENPVVKTIIKKTKLSYKNLTRAYVNLFLQKEEPFFHQDSVDKNSKTLLYYVNDEPQKIDDLGETFFYINEEIKGVQPVPGRVIIFDGEIWHRASSLRNYDRFTIALKWENIL